MRAAVLSEAGAPLEVTDLDAAPIAPNDVVVRTGASGLCHSDQSLRRAPAGTLPLPIVMGHEGAGEVVEVGREVRNLRPGDRVIAAWVASCRECYWCTHGQANLCSVFKLGAARPPWRLPDGSEVHAQSGIGTMAELMTTDARSFVKVETDLPDEQLALVGCGVATGAMAAMRAAPVTPGSTVAVVGCGGVGTSAVQGARIAGAVTIIAVDPLASKREAALRLGATDAVDPGDGDPIEAIRDLTGGRGVDVGIDTGGTPTTATLAVEATRKGGTAVCVGGARPSVDGVSLLNPKTVKWTLYGDADPARDFPMLVGMAEAGLLDLGSVVSRRIRLDEVMDGFEAMERGEVLRSVIVFS
jgi:S-(hydroxymethyl)glutathione dehydrogenase/alcohol dehydrogenase